MAHSAFDSASRSRVALGRGSIPALPRLARLREAILAAEYGLCTQKAELMTKSMRVEAPLPATTVKLAPLHFRAVRKTLADNLASGAPAQHWQLLMSKYLQQLWLGLDHHAQTQATIVVFGKALAHTLTGMDLIICADELLVGNQLWEAKLGSLDTEQQPLGIRSPADEYYVDVERRFAEHQITARLSR